MLFTSFAGVVISLSHSHLCSGWLGILVERRKIRYVQSSQSAVRNPFRLT